MLSTCDEQVLRFVSFVAIWVVYYCNQHITSLCLFVLSC